jgi:NADH:ubiquinone reductase (H+-translocating)
MVTQNTKRILILGGGFGGLYTALGLEKALAGDSSVEITLVNRENFFLFTPMLHEIAASDLDFTHIVNPLRKLLKKVKFFHGEVQTIDFQSRGVRVFHGPERHPHELNYDYLVIALGSTTNFYGMPGLQDRSLTMKSLGDAIHLRNRLIDLLEEADFECAVGAREGLLTVLVAGGGFAGVETVAAVNDFLRDALPSYPHLTQNLIRIVLVHPGVVVLPELGARLGLYAQEKLAKRGVEIRVNVKVRGISNNGVELDDGTTIKANTVVWTAGTSPSVILESLPCAKQHGKLVVNQFMEVPGHPGVWALGDCAAGLDPKTGKPFPPTAQHAMRQGKVVARNILATLRGRKKRPFEFSTIGLLAAIGRRTGVANILGVNFSGFVAWFLWRTIYLSKLPRIEKKVRVALDWTLDLLFSKDLVHFMILRSPAISSREEPHVQADRGEQVIQISRRTG